MAYFLGVDGGQSSTTAILGDESGRVLGYGRGGPCNHVEASEGRAKFLRAMDGCLTPMWQQAGLHPETRISHACLGFSGGPEDKEAILHQILPADHIHVSNDALIALSGATAGAPGIITIAGTGSISYGRNAAGKAARAGGWGFTFGDEGGGFDLVRQALRGALRMEEGWGPPTSLRMVLLEATGATTANELLHKFYTTDFPRPRIAAMSKLVDQAAIHGDPVAREILNNAAHQLASYTSAVRGQLFISDEAVPIAYIGGVWRSAFLLERFTSLLELQDGNQVGPPVYGPATGALLEAYRAAGLQVTVTNVPESGKMKYLVFLVACLANAAEPDWTNIDKKALAFLQTYIRIQSINPPADVRQAAALFERELKTNGLSPKLFPIKDGMVNLVVRLPGKDRTKKPLLLLNHFDVVPVDPKAWRVDPFGALIKDGWIYGRGTMDMKGVGVMHLFTLILLKQMGITPARDIVMLSTADEETNGTNGIRTMIRDYWNEIECEYVLDEGGFGSMDVYSPGKLVFGISVGEKQSAWVRLTAKGTAAHGSQPIPENANMILMQAIQKAMNTPDRGKPNPVVDIMRKNLDGKMADNKFVRAIQGNTMSLTTLHAGVGSPPKVNVIPSTSEATIDCRLMPGVNAAEFFSEMKARINDPRVTLEQLSDPADPGISKMDTPLFAALRSAIRTQHANAVVTPILIPYGTDSVRLRQKGVIAYGISPMVVDAATVATMHSDEERIPVAEFHRGLRIFYELLKSDF